MAYIRDLVTLDQHAEFRNDVQLSHYDNPNTNLGLLRSFIFSYNAPTGKVSSVDLLDTLRSVFTIARQENRLVCIANYGHGKSHLALVLANYFAKPYGSPELEQVLAKLAKAVDNQTRLQRLREFRQDQGEFLVIRLRGDINRGLREQCIDQIQVALQDHEATKNERLSFWSDKALQLLDRLTNEQKEKAEAFLETMETDLAGLRGDVRNHRDLGYDRVRLLFQHLTGVLPDLGGEVSLNALIKQVAKDYCGEGKPLAGIVILFDEFSLFVQRYAQRRSAGELQELLVGVEELGNKALFLAFSQHDPLTVAKNYANSQDQVDNLEKELSRLPKERRIFLYSLLESVIDAYLNQPEGAWASFASSHDVKGPLGRASIVAMSLFSRRYEEELRWGPEKFDQIVTRGAFPLHPLTTALLCNLTLGGSEVIGNPRTLLGFIREQVAKRQDQPALENGQINWILPIFLVDYFRDYLGKDFYQLYEIAESKLPDNAPPEQQRLLKALLLQNVAGLKLRRDDQESFLGEAAGIPFNATKGHLIALAASQCILKDESKGIYTFWSSTTDPDALKKKLQKKLAGKEVTWDLLDALTQQQVKAISVDVKWGHPEDWEAKEVILTRNYFTPERLQELFPRFRMTSMGTLEEGVRGGVVWLVPESSDDAAWFKQHAEEVLDQAFTGEFPLPIIIKTTSRPYSKLLPAFQALKELEAMTEQERKEVTVELYDHEKRQQEAIIRTEMITLRGEATNFTSIPHKLSNYIVPAAYRSLVSLSANPSIKQVLEETYRHAYRFSPPEFFTQYRNPARGTNNLWKATRLLSAQLLRNSISANMVSLRTDKVALDTLQKFLYGKWKVVRPDHAIQEPGNGNTARAWSLLEETFKPGVRSTYVRDTIIKLMNPPYGYDYNTLTLLLSAWIGYNQHDLQFSSMGRQISIEGLTSILNDTTGKKTTFIGEICGQQKVAISRRDSAELIREVNELIERVNKETFDQNSAEEIIAKLQAYCQDAGLPEETCKAAQSGLERLSNGLELAKTYDQQAKAIQNELDNGREIQGFLQLKKRISELPHTSLVSPKQKSVTDLDNTWRTVILQKVEAECVRLEKVSRLQDVRYNQDRLESMKNLLKASNLPSLIERVQKALTEISRREQELVIQEQETPIQTEIRSMDRRMPLKTLKGYLERLGNIQDLSTATMHLRDQLQMEIADEISQLEQLADLLMTGVNNIDSPDTARTWESTYLRSYMRFEGTDLQEMLDTSHQKVEKTQGFFAKLNEIKQQPRNDLRSMEDIICQLETLYAEVKPWLGENALQPLVQSLQQVQRQKTQRCEEAHQWLAKAESMLNQGETLVNVIRALQTPQPFLLAEDMQRLELLKQRVQQKQEEDAIARIEIEFRKIVEPSLRQECLRRLQAIAEENEGSTVR